MLNYQFNILIVTLLITANTFAQNKKEAISLDGKFSVATGLIQPLLLKGRNIAATFHSKKWVFEYSHGMFLHYPKIVRKDKGLTSLYSVYSTGPGIGYRLTGNLDIRFEVKVHQYKAGLNSKQSVTYTNADAGLGLYSRNYFLKKRHSKWKMLFLEHSFRYWQNFHSTLAKRQLLYIDKNGVERVHKPHNIGFFYNLSIGYTFSATKSNKNGK